MPNHRNTWDTLVSEYIRKVEKALATVDHPRKVEVIEDLRNHLEDCYADIIPEKRTTEHLKTLIAELDTPQSYAELLTPATGAAPSKWYRRRLFRYAIVLVSLLIVARYLLLPDTELGLSVRDWLKINYVTPPFFNEDNFARVQPGMTPDQVRDLIGISSSRGIIDTKEVPPERNFEDEPVARWDYMTGTLPGLEVNYYSVYFDRQANRVSKTQIVHSQYPRDRADRFDRDQRLQALADRKKNIGTLKLLRPDKADLTLRPSDQKPCFIFDSGDQLCEYKYKIGDLDEIVQYVKKYFGWLEAEGVPIVYLMRGSRAKEYGQAIMRGDIDKAKKVFTASNPEFRTRDSQWFFYNQGVLYELPPLYADMEASWRTDHQWLIRKLIK